jgi:uncharacterized protein
MALVEEGNGMADDKAAGAPVAEFDCQCECERDRHLFCRGPKRILALDGGGVRGAITVAFLEQIEKVLAERFGKPVHLANWFDLIGGTSTGAVIAGALALGYTTEDIRNFYLKLAPKVFKWSLWRLIRLKPKFDAEALRQEIEYVVGERTLDSADLHTGFCLISKRLDTGSPWIVANNPRNLYWDTVTGKDGFIGNRYYKLANLVRASTAAPFYFDPETLEVVAGEKKGLFVDGGVTPHNNPSVMLFLMAIFKAYKIRWTANPENLTIVSIGTGTNRGRVVPEELGMGWTLKMTYHALMSLMNDIQTFALTQMQYLGECLTPWWINSEVGALEQEQPINGKMFRFMRYDVQLELPWIEKELGAEAETVLGRKLTRTDVTRWRSMDDPTIIEEIYKLAQIAAKKQVKAEHWVGEAATWCNGCRPSAQPRTMVPRKPEPPPIGYVIGQSIARRASYLRSWLARRVPRQPPTPKE